jgi:hypothetical protein
VANSDPEHGDQPERIEITVAELLAQRSSSGAAPTRRPTRHADTVFGRLSPRRRAVVTASAVVAAGSVVATALFGPTHLFRSTEPVPTGSHDPDGGHPDIGPPALPHAAPPPGAHGLGDLPDPLNPLATPPSTLPTLTLLTTPDGSQRPAAPARVTPARTVRHSRAPSPRSVRTASGGASRSTVGDVGNGVIGVGPASLPLDEPAAGLGQLTNDDSVSSAGSALSSLTRL